MTIENSKREFCNTNQLTDGVNFGKGDIDNFNETSILNNCYDFAIDGNITMTVSKSGTNLWAFCWAKVYVSNTDGYYHCKNPKSETIPWVYHGNIKIQCTGPPSE